MAKLVQQLNARLFERAWHPVAPPWWTTACLFVSGQRRARRTTAQDRPGQRPGAARWLCAAADLEGICQRFSDTVLAALATRVPGPHHGQQPDWRNGRRFGQPMRQWLDHAGARQPDEAGHFLDAHAVAGDALLDAVEEGAELGWMATDNDAVLARVCRRDRRFGSSRLVEPPVWPGRRGERPMNRKRRRASFPRSSACAAWRWPGASRDQHVGAHRRRWCRRRARRRHGR